MGFVSRGLVDQRGHDKSARRCSVAQWQSVRLLSGWLVVRVHLGQQRGCGFESRPAGFMLTVAKLASSRTRGWFGGQVSTIKN